MLDYEHPWWGCMCQKIIQYHMWTPPIMPVVEVCTHAFSWHKSNLHCSPSQFLAALRIVYGYWLISYSWSPPLNIASQVTVVVISKTKKNNNTWPETLSSFQMGEKKTRLELRHSLLNISSEIWFWNGFAAKIIPNLKTLSSKY